MRIVNVSYSKIATSEPQKWLRSISFFTGILRSLSGAHEVHSLHCALRSDSVVHEGVTYEFFKLNIWRKIFPSHISARVRQIAPDIVIAHGLHFPWQIMLLRLALPGAVKLFVQHHAEIPSAWPKKLLQRFADKFIDGYFFSSRKLATQWVAEGIIMRSQKVHEIMEASSPFHPVPADHARKALGVVGSPVYVWVGRLDKNKDPETLLKAFTAFAKIHPGASLYMIFQHDELLNDVQKLAENSQQIFLIGKVPHDVIVNWYSVADFIVSTSHYEGSGIAVCEAMSCGCIPILSNIPSFQMMTNNGEVGMLYKPGDPDSLCRTLFKTLEIVIPAEKQRVLDQFHKRLSFQAIAKQIYSVVSSTP